METMTCEDHPKGTGLDWETPDPKRRARTGSLGRLGQSADKESKAGWAVPGARAGTNQGGGGEPGLESRGGHFCTGGSRQGLPPQVQSGMEGTPQMPRAAWRGGGMPPTETPTGFLPTGTEMWGMLMVLKVQF